MPNLKVSRLGVNTGSSAGNGSADSLVKRISDAVNGSGTAANGVAASELAVATVNGAVAAVSGTAATISQAATATATDLTAHEGLTTAHSATAAATANRMVVRDANGRAKFTAPSAATDAANKAYVDTAAGTATSEAKAYTDTATANVATKSYVDSAVTGAATDASGAVAAHAALTTAHGAAAAATANRIVLRDANGRAKFSDPSAAADAATKGYVDTAVAEGTTDAATRTYVDTAVATVNSAATAHAALTTAHSATAAATANRMVVRDANGRAKFSDPSAAADAATKGYVDTAIAEGTTDAATRTYVDTAVATVNSAATAHAALTTAHSATAAATAGRMVVRDGNGRAKFADPTAAADAATKGYVDTALAGTQPNMGITALGGAPSTQAFGDAAAVGSAASVARSDHKHAMPPAPTTITGNAATATKLATARTISLSGKVTGTATPFNGSANIDIPVTAVTADSCTGNAATAGRLATARTIDGVSFNGSADIITPVNITAKLTAAKTIYCAPAAAGAGTGSSEADAMELQTAINSLSTINIDGYTVTFSLAAGTYTGNYEFYTRNPYKTGAVVFSGADVTSTVFSPSSGSSLSIYGSIRGNSGSGHHIYIRNCRFKVVSSHAIRAYDGGQVVLDQGTTFDVLGGISCVYVGPRCSVSIRGTAEIRSTVSINSTEGSASTYFIYQDYESYLYIGYVDFVITGAPAFSAWLYRAGANSIYWANNTYTGNVAPATVRVLRGACPFGYLADQSTMPGMRGAAQNLPVAGLDPSQAANRVLRTGTANTDPAWGPVNLTTDVTGSLPIANGGTGAATAAAALTSLGAVASTDSRLSNTRTPTAHASTATTYGVSSAGNYGHAMASSATPLAAGTASAGTDNGKFAREGHVHPLQTTVTGNAATASKLATARTIALTGDVTGSGSFDGSANLSVAATGVQAAALKTARTIALSGKVTGTATSFNGSANIAIPVTAVTADSCTGNAATADTLATARTIRTNLASTSAAGFNGSANVVPGVTGILPLANGGTGAAAAALACQNLGITDSNKRLLGPLYTAGNNETAGAYAELFAYQERASPVTGTLCIKLPALSANMMLNLDIKVYTHTTNRSNGRVLAGGYFRTDGTIGLHSAMSLNMNTVSSVRFAWDGTRHYILLGTTGTSWSYPAISVSTLALYNTINLTSGWGVSFLTDEAGLSNMVTPDLNSGLGFASSTGLTLAAWAHIAEGATNVLKASANIVSATRAAATPYALTLALKSGLFSNTENMLITAQSYASNYQAIINKSTMTTTSASLTFSSYGGDYTSAGAFILFYNGGQ